MVNGKFIMIVLIQINKSTREEGDLKTVLRIKQNQLSPNVSPK